MRCNTPWNQRNQMEDTLFHACDPPHRQNPREKLKSLTRGPGNEKAEETHRKKALETSLAPRLMSTNAGTRQWQGGRRTKTRSSKCETNRLELGILPKNALTGNPIKTHTKTTAQQSVHFGLIIYNRNGRSAVLFRFLCERRTKRQEHPSNNKTKKSYSVR